MFETVVNKYKNLKRRYILAKEALSKEIPLTEVSYVASIFWMTAALIGLFVGGEDTNNYSQALTYAQFILIIFAILLQIVLPIYIYVTRGPFLIKSSWYPVSEGKNEARLVHREKLNNRLRLKSCSMDGIEKIGKIRLPTEVFENLEGYELEFKKKKPLRISLEDYDHHEQGWMGHKNILRKKEGANASQSFAPLCYVKLEDDRHLGTGDHWIKIIDRKNNTLVLEIEVTD